MKKKFFKKLFASTLVAGATLGLAGCEIKFDNNPEKNEVSKAVQLIEEKYNIKLNEKYTDSYVKYFKEYDSNDDGEIDYYVYSIKFGYPILVDPDGWSGIIGTKYIPKNIYGYDFKWKITTDEYKKIYELINNGELTYPYEYIIANHDEYKLIDYIYNFEWEEKIQEDNPYKIWVNEIKQLFEKECNIKVNEKFTSQLDIETYEYSKPESTYPYDDDELNFYVYFDFQNENGESGYYIKYLISAEDYRAFNQAYIDFSSYYEPEEYLDKDNNLTKAIEHIVKNYEPIELADNSIYNDKENKLERKTDKDLEM